jgi:hypothetical protein
MNASAADVDRDGDLDILVAMEWGVNRLFLNDGRGKFTEASDRLPQNDFDSEDIVSADFDGDGDVDVAVANEDDLLQELYINTGKGRFEDASKRLAVRAKANGLAAVDVDKDGDIDQFFGGDKVSHLLINDGKANFTDESLTRLPRTSGGTQHVAAADLDRDGDIDFVLGNEDRNQIYINNGKGVFGVGEGLIPRPKQPEETRDVEVFDADKDGDLDLFFANVRMFNLAAEAKNRLLLNDGKGVFTDVSAAWLSGEEALTISALAIDVDRDGRMDLITGEIGPLENGLPVAPVKVLRNTGFKFVDETARFLPGVKANALDILAADFDGDRRLDLFIASRGGPDRLFLTRRR